MNEMSISEARKALNTLTEQMTPKSRAVAITRRGKPVLAILDWELYETILETLEVMADGEAMDSLRRSLGEVAAGRTVPADEVAAELGL
jgi:PHD/YefM family antitoxin component YafN of YafNO toxin-antitoxin module